MKHMPFHFIHVSAWKLLPKWSVQPIAPTEGVIAGKRLLLYCDPTPVSQRVALLLFNSPLLTHQHSHQPRTHSHPGSK